MRHLLLLSLLVVGSSSGAGTSSAEPIRGETASPLTLEAAIDMALEQNPAIGAAREAIAEADARVRQERANYYTQINSSGLAKAGLSGALNGLQPVGLPNSPFYRNFANALNIYHPGLDFGRTKHAVRFRERQAEALGSDLESVEASLILETSRAYYRVLEAQRLDQAARKAVTSRETTLRQARAFYEGEIRSKVDFDLARVGHAEAQFLALEARNTLRVAMAELASALGDAEASGFELSEPELTIARLGLLTTLIEQAHENRPELISLEIRRSAASEAIALARSQRKPKLSFFFSGGWARIAPLTASTLLAIGTGLQLPVFTFGRLEGNIEEAEARLRVLDKRFEDLRQQIVLQTRTSYYRLENAIESIPVRQVQTEASSEAVRLARARYREQLGSMVELNESEALLAQAEAHKASAVYAAKIAEAELEFATGRWAASRPDAPHSTASP